MEKYWPPGIYQISTGHYKVRVNRDFTVTWIGVCYNGQTKTPDQWAWESSPGWTRVGSIEPPEDPHIEDDY